VGSRREIIDHDFQHRLNWIDGSHAIDCEIRRRCTVSDRRQLPNRAGVLVRAASPPERSRHRVMSVVPVDLQRPVFAVMVRIVVVLVDVRPRRLHTYRDECEENPACDELAHV
jgi:hypothetical protein